MRRWWIPGVGAGILAADQVMKNYVEENVDPAEEKPFTEHTVLRKVHNQGMCLNLLCGKPEVVRNLSLGVTGALTLLLTGDLFRKGRFWEKLGLAFLTAGAWSNTVDRLARGYVVDYMGAKKTSQKSWSVTWNLADLSIGAGALIVSLVFFFRGGKRKSS